MKSRKISKSKIYLYFQNFEILESKYGRLAEEDDDDGFEPPEMVEIDEEYYEEQKNIKE